MDILNVVDLQAVRVSLIRELRTWKDNQLASKAALYYYIEDLRFRYQIICFLYCKVANLPTSAFSEWQQVASERRKSHIWNIKRNKFYDQAIPSTKKSTMHSIVFLSALAHAFTLIQNSDLGALITSATLKPDLRLPQFVNGAAKKYDNTWNVNRNLYLIADNSAQIESQAADQIFNWGQDVQCSECKFLRKGVVRPKENQQLRTACVISRGTPPNQWLNQWLKFGFPPNLFYNDFLQVLLQSKNGVKGLSLADQKSESTDIVAYWTSKRELQSLISF